MVDIESTQATTAPAVGVASSEAGSYIGSVAASGLEEVGMSSGEVLNTMNAPDPRQGNRRCLCLGAYTWPILGLLGFLVLFVMLAVALGLSVEAVAKSNEAVAISSAALCGGKGLGESTNIPMPNEPTGQAALVPAPPPIEPTPPPSTRPQSAQSDEPTDMPTPTHEQRPQWFQIHHRDYQEQALFFEEKNITVTQFAQAFMFCNK